MGVEEQRILVVEDNPDNQKLISWLLEDEGWSFVCAWTAEEALDLAKREQFDLILMDISLPGMNGKEATRILRETENYATTPILAVTAHAVKGEVEQILASGVTALITKPIDEDRMAEQIRACLDREVEHG